MTTDKDQSPLEKTQESEPEHPMFILRIQMDKAHDAKDALRKVGVDFEPEQQIVVLGTTDNYNEEANGYDAHNIRDLINDFLEDLELSPTLPDGDLNLQQIHEVLRIASGHLYWHNISSVSDFLHGDGARWESVTQNFPSLFQPQENPETGQNLGRVPCQECESPAEIFDSVGGQNYCRPCATDLALERMTDDGEFQTINQ